MNRIEHRNFAVNTLGVDAAEYDSLNAKNDAIQWEVRAARRAVFEANTDAEREAAEARMDAAVKAARK
jgi:hypothetical protein